MDNLQHLAGLKERGEPTNDRCRVFAVHIQGGSGATIGKSD
ncbi:hypothetical protein [Pseudomonas proteolytica]|nr:hypothetical protein [Pseudomonas proteolytica]